MAVVVGRIGVVVEVERWWWWFGRIGVVAEVVVVMPSRLRRRWLSNAL
jgi:hypothetical protein